LKNTQKRIFELQVLILTIRLSELSRFIEEKTFQDSNLSTHLWA